jgi:hypothetical protein
MFGRDDAAVAAIDTFGLVIGDVAAAVAAVAAVTGLSYARQTVREARAERIAAELARLTRRVEWVGETIEHIDRLAEDDLRMRPTGDTWRRGCHLLAQGFVGLDSRLPQTAQLVYCADPYSARSIAAVAREEVSAELARLAREQASSPDAGERPARGRPGLAGLPNWMAGVATLLRRDGRDENGLRQRTDGSERVASHQPSHRLNRDEGG